VRAKFLGNTTLHVTDGQTVLLVDGFVSRPGVFDSFVRDRISPDEAIIKSELDRAGIGKVDALLVGHAHADHALDTPTVARLKGAFVMGNVSYRYVHEGAGLPVDRDHLFMVPCHGNQRKFGRFTVTFVESDHVTARLRKQKKIEGHITKPVRPPAKFTDYKCGDVYAIHIAHPDGNLLVTTTAGAKAGKLDCYQADVVFLGIGLLSKECPCQQESYWRETVAAVDARTVVPVHWDRFTTKLSRGLKPTPWFVDNLRATTRWMKAKSHEQDRQVIALGLHDSLLLRRGKVRGKVRREERAE
jgi:L-ascorbate metabolism protein UlaG (beta-lactamase superfamily)